jgi:hypothetical protein
MRMITVWANDTEHLNGQYLILGSCFALPPPVTSALALTTCATKLYLLKRFEKSILVSLDGFRKKGYDHLVFVCEAFLRSRVAAR